MNVGGKSIRKQLKLTYLGFRNNPNNVIHSVIFRDVLHRGLVVIKFSFYRFYTLGVTTRYICIIYISNYSYLFFSIIILFESPNIY